jgi:hypothetical protein
MSPLQRIRKAAREQRYRISSHANEEMADDDLVLNDVQDVLERGKIVAGFTRDARGKRYELAGRTSDGRRASVVCRFLPSGALLVITAYAAEN